MPTEAQKSRKVQWNSQENYSSAAFHGYTCLVTTTHLGEEVLIWNSMNEQVFNCVIGETRRRAEIRAELELKKLAGVQVSKASGFYGKTEKRR